MVKSQSPETVSGARRGEWFRYGTAVVAVAAAALSAVRSGALIDAVLGLVVGAAVALLIYHDRRAQRDLSLACEEMERRVQQRTGRLSQINDALREEILERKRVEQEVLEISEKEQCRLGMHIHDDLCQSLTGIMILLKVLTQRLERAEHPEAAEVKKIGELLDDAITRARDMARGVYPVELTADSLMIALGDLAARTQTLFSVTCRFVCPDPVLLDDNTRATHLYRIAQEGVRNAIEHGKAQWIEVRLYQQDGRMHLEIENDGKGPVVESEHHAGIGRRIMQYRARMIGATLETHDVQPHGILLACVFPHAAVGAAADYPTGSAA